MNYEDLLENEQAIFEAGSLAGYESGYDDGFEAGVEVGLDSETDCEDSYESGREVGFMEGAKAEQKRIQSVLNMMFESSLNLGQGSKAVQYKHAMDLLRPINFEYDEDKYWEDLKNDGF
jgi:hypothetical protein